MKGIGNYAGARLAVRKRGAGFLDLHVSNIQNKESQG